VVGVQSNTKSYKKTRDLTTSLLIDISGSTSEEIQNNVKALDIKKGQYLS
jgi:nitric oxide reductase activation protein